MIKATDFYLQTYLDYVNNYLTFEKMGEHYRISSQSIRSIVREGSYIFAMRMMDELRKKIASVQESIDGLDDLIQELDELKSEYVEESIIANECDSQAISDEHDEEIVSCMNLQIEHFKFLKDLTKQLENYKEMLPGGKLDHFAD